MDQEEDPWFVAKDVCDVLGLEARDTVRYLDDDEKSYVSRKHIGMNPGKDMTIINESGLYSLILRSRKPEAKAFKKWVTSETDQIEPWHPVYKIYHLKDALKLQQGLYFRHKTVGPYSTMG